MILKKALSSLRANFDAQRWFQLQASFGVLAGLLLMSSAVYGFGFVNSYFDLVGFLCAGLLASIVCLLAWTVVEP